MLDLEKINAEIKSLEETKCTTYGVCEKLAMLYTVRDHYAGGEITPKEEVEDSMMPHPSRVL